MSCTATGTPPIQTKAMWNSSVMANASDVLTIHLNKEGKYVCEAKNQFGKDKKEFSVKFAGKNALLRLLNGRATNHKKSFGYIVHQWCMSTKQKIVLTVVDLPA